MLDRLESRRLLAAAVSEHVLVITGTTGNDDIKLVLGGNVFTLTFNGEESLFNASKIKSIVVNCGDGDDRFELQDSQNRIASTPSAGDISALGYRAVAVNGEGGDDYLQGGGGNDTIDGGDGNDSLFGAGGDDVVRGGAGRDTLDGYVGDDLLAGGGGRDTVTYHSQYHDFEISADGVKNDRGWFVTGKATDAITRSLQSTDNVMPDVENIIGGFGDDIIKGSGGDNYLDGGLGDDTLNGGPGADTINGNFGDDDLWGGGGEGDVVDYSDRFDPLNITFDNARNDGAHATASHPRERDLIHDDFEGALCGHKADYVTGTSKGETFVGGSGKDTLIGNGGADLITNVEVIL